jgi:hypothetical protein
MRIAIVRHAFLSIVLAVCTAAPVLCAPLAGSWSIAPTDVAGQVQLSLTFKGPDYTDNNSIGVDPTTMGLSREQLNSAGQHVSFTLAHDAGSIVCDGWVAHGSGGGAATFNPNPVYASKMRALGYDNLTPREQLTATMLDISIAYAQDIASVYPHLPFRDLVSFRALHIDGSYIRSMRATFSGADVDAGDIISLQALHVTPGYITQLRQAGFTVSSPHDAVSLMALHVDLPYVKGLASAGYSNLTSSQLIQLRAMHIDAEYIAKVHAHGLAHPTVEELVRLKAMNII